MTKKAAKPTFRPLAYCPDDQRKRYEKRALTAIAGSRKAAMELACCHCMGWQSHLVRDCSDPGCPLWKWAVKSK